MPRSGARRDDLRALGAQGYLDGTAVEGHDDRLLVVVEPGNAFQATQPQPGKLIGGGSVREPHQTASRDVRDQEERGRRSQRLSQGVGDRLHGLER